MWPTPRFVHTHFWWNIEKLSVVEAVMIIPVKELYNVIWLNKSSDVEACVVHFALDASEIPCPFSTIV